MRKVLKKSMILYKPLFQVIIAGPVGVPIMHLADSTSHWLGMQTE